MYNVCNIHILDVSSSATRYVSKLLANFQQESTYSCSIFSISSTSIQSSVTLLIHSFVNCSHAFHSY